MHVSVTFLGLQRAKAQSDQIEIQFSKRTRVADVFAYIKKHHPELPFDQKASEAEAEDSERRPRLRFAHCAWLKPLESPCATRSRMRRLACAW